MFSLGRWSSRLPAGFHVPCGTCVAPRRPSLRLRGHCPLRRAFPCASAGCGGALAATAPPLSLAATRGIDVSFSSCGYLDGSVRRVPLRALFGSGAHAGPAAGGLPHSETRGSKAGCASPRIIAASRVLPRLPAPRHPPCALHGLPWAPAGGPARLAARPSLSIAANRPLRPCSKRASRFSCAACLSLCAASAAPNRRLRAGLSVLCLSTGGLGRTRTYGLALIRRALSPAGLQAPVCCCCIKNARPAWPRRPPQGRLLERR